jgi:hypothetical protein
MPMTNRITFVDFMYGIVIGAAFPLVAPLELSFRFAGMMFLVIVILEDFYLYHTQIAIYETPDQKPSFIVLVTEISILLAWYLTAIGFPHKKVSFLIAFGAFFLLKWIAGLAYWISLKRFSDWRFHRNHTFLLPITACIILGMCTKGNDLVHPVVWITILVVWVVQTAIWWTITTRLGRLSR